MSCEKARFSKVDTCALVVHGPTRLEGPVTDGKGNSFLGEQGPQGPQGPEGPEGPQGPAGPGTNSSFLQASRTQPTGTLTQNQWTDVTIDTTVTASGDWSTGGSGDWTTTEDGVFDVSAVAFFSIVCARSYVRVALDGTGIPGSIGQDGALPETVNIRSARGRTLVTMTSGQTLRLQVLSEGPGTQTLIQPNPGGLIQEGTPVAQLIVIKVADP